MEEIIYSPKLPNQSGPDREFESSSIVFQSLCFVHYECLTVSLKAVKVKKLRKTQRQAGSGAIKVADVAKGG